MSTQNLTTTTPQSARRRKDFFLPCGFTPTECNVEAVGRASHPTDIGRASTYVCPNHVDWGKSWVEAQTGERGIFAPFRNGKTEADDE